jgi:SAM-dependent methyltransferase
MSEPAGSSRFNEFATDYDAIHKKNLAISGEEPVYFARQKVEALRRWVDDCPETRVLDFGCAVGVLTAQLASHYRHVTGHDVAKDCLERARERVPAATFVEDPEGIPPRSFGLAVMANVLHHVPPAQRDAVMARVVGALAPGGALAVFEHNPLNPVTRYVVRDCAFDDDAILLPPWETWRRMGRAGLVDVRVRFTIFFPRPLAFLRGLEPRLARLPVGGQYLATGRRPA